MAEAIREVVSQAILHEVSDPRVDGITVLHVEVSSDLRSASAYISIMGDKTKQDQAMKGLKSATGFLQSLVAARLQTRFTPVLSFKRDDGIKKSVEMSKLIEETLAQDRDAVAATPETDREIDDDDDRENDDDLTDDDDDDEPTGKPTR